MVQLGHAGEKKGEDDEASEDFARREKHHFGLRDLEVMETLGASFSCQVAWVDTTELRERIPGCQESLNSCT